jgi:hypothetical protein
MKKGKRILHFRQVPLKTLGKLLEKKSRSSAGDSELPVERPTLKTEPYSMPFAVQSKTSR